MVEYKVNLDHKASLGKTELMLKWVCKVLRVLQDHKVYKVNQEDQVLKDHLDKTELTL